MWEQCFQLLISHTQQSMTISVIHGDYLLHLHTETKSGILPDTNRNYPSASQARFKTLMKHISVLIFRIYIKSIN